MSWVVRGDVAACFCVHKRLDVWQTLPSWWTKEWECYLLKRCRR